MLQRLDLSAEVGVCVEGLCLIGVDLGVLGAVNHRTVLSVGAVCVWSASVFVSSSVLFLFLSHPSTWKTESADTTERCATGQPGKCDVALKLAAVISTC